MVKIILRLEKWLDRNDQKIGRITGYFLLVFLGWMLGIMQALIWKTKGW